jgi:hypothetical protein
VLSPNGFQLVCASPEPVKPHEVVERREAAGHDPGRAFVVLRRKPDGELAHVRVAERIVGEHARIVLEHDDRAGRRCGAFLGHGLESPDLCTST